MSPQTGVEEANGWKDRELFGRRHIYSHFTRTNRKPVPTIPWARRMEQAFTDQGRTQTRAGDPVFSHQPADQGHIGPLGAGPDGKL
ncbi:hypothetical protein [Deinococcus hopiensis]|uniref:hypothetical protein n=1 Tax=Deinococcus hopiensis TaxID=309885 RepID=UPI000A0271E4|nr:hypothetical protein [Deinococcus hopiensis]